MTYARVCPRDLFNEASLLKCLGHLWPVCERIPGVGWVEPQIGEPFVIEQYECDG